MRLKHIALILLLIAPSAWATSKCNSSTTGGSTTLSCEHMTQTISSGYFVPRQVKYQVPDGTPPADGWPAVVMFQPSAFPIFWSVPDWVPAGAFYQVQLIEALLDRGYAVIEPPTNKLKIYQYWETNQPGVDDWYDYTTTDDYSFLTNVFQAIDNGEFGPIDISQLYATGMSSGGYNTSRMAKSFNGRFQALAIQAGSWATCLGPFCELPASLPADHPPTLFVHGEQDSTVSIDSMRPYHEQLLAQGIDSALELDANAGHEYLPSIPVAIPDWFDAVRNSTPYSSPGQGDSGGETCNTSSPSSWQWPNGCVYNN